MGSPLTAALKGALVAPLMGAWFAPRDLPPAAQDALVFAFDPADTSGGQAPSSLVGPTPMLGTTSGPDTNDPTLVSRGTTSYYAMGPDDCLHLGTVLDNIFTSTVGFSALAGCDVTTQEQSNYWNIFAKDREDVQGGRAWLLGFGAGKAGGEIRTASGKAPSSYNATVVTTGPQHFGLVWGSPTGGTSDITLTAWAAQQIAARSATYAAADIPLVSNTTSLRIGARDTNDRAAARPGPVYLYNRPLSDAEMADNLAWLAGRGWL